MAKASAFFEDEGGPRLREGPSPQKIAVSPVFCGIDPNFEGAKRSRNWVYLTIYLIHVNKAWKVAASFSKKHQIGGVKKPRSLRLQSLLGFRYITWKE